jgi:hypothetical protein
MGHEYFSELFYLGHYHFQIQQKNATKLYCEKDLSLCWPRCWSLFLHPFPKSTDRTFWPLLYIQNSITWWSKWQAPEPVTFARDTVFIRERFLQRKLYSSFSSEALKKTDGCGKTIDAGSIAEIGSVQGPQKLDEGSGETMHPGTTDRGFTVLVPAVLIQNRPWPIIVHRQSFRITVWRQQIRP